MPLFSVIIPTFNRAALLRETLKSVFAQTCTDFEVVVVDDGSTDQTVAMVNNLGDGVRCIRQKNQGPGAARNLGVQEAIGDYIAFLDSDDLWFPWTLETYAKVLGKESAIGILLGKVFRFSMAEELQGQTVSPLQASNYEDFLTAGQESLFFGTNYVVIKRNLLLNEESLTRKICVFEDQDLGLRLGVGIPCAAVESPVTVGYRQTSGSLTADSNRALGGIRYLINSERAGLYPGGARRRWERRNYISFSIRSVSFGLLQEGQLKAASSLYHQSFFWHLRLGRLRYVIGFPLLIAKQLLTRIWRN